MAFLKINSSALLKNHVKQQDPTPIVQSLANNLKSPPRRNMNPVRAFMRRKLSQPVRAFLYSTTVSPVTRDKSQLEFPVNAAEL